MPVPAASQYGDILVLGDPAAERWPYAAVQLRQENLRADSYNIVGELPGGVDYLTLEDLDRYEAFMGGLVELIVDKYDGSLKAGLHRRWEDLKQHKLRASQRRSVRG